jgi:peroxiredoxin
MKTGRITMMRGTALAGALAVSLFMIAAAGVGLTPSRAAGGQGGSVPNFVLKNMDGKDVSLANLRAKGPVLIDFWATWCRPCLHELPYIEALHKEHGPRGLQVVAITVDDTRSIAKAKTYVKTSGYTFTVLSDPNQRTLRDFKGVTCPYLVLLSPEGERLYTHSGYREGDEKELAKVVAEVMAEAKAPSDEGTAPDAGAGSTGEGGEGAGEGGR